MTSLTPLSRLLLAGLLALALPAALRAMDATANPAAEIDTAEIESRDLARVQERAATYRLGRERAVTSPATEPAAAAYLAQARELLATGRSQPLESGWDRVWPWYWFPSDARRARWLAQAGLGAYPYSRVAADLHATVLSAYAVAGDIGGIYDSLLEIWYFYPDYAHLPMVMEVALGAAERQQNFQAKVNLFASRPKDVIDITGGYDLTETNKLYHFLARHGDRETIAPRAALGLARGLLCTHDRKEIVLARREYEDFLDAYPNHPLAFPALCELALSYLVVYGGDQHDVWVLFRAATIIDQAEIETHGVPELARIVENYRKRIRAWHQDRDLYVARWYRDRASEWLGWLKCPAPPIASWVDGARYYYREVVKRDSGSEQARFAQLELEELPAPLAPLLGTPTPPVKP